MTVDRRVLQQALAEAGQISQRAEQGIGFDPRGGYGVLAAQLGNAAIGAFAQNRARKKLAEQERQSQLAFASNAGIDPELAKQLSPETREAFVAKQLLGSLESPTPLSNIGKIQSDLDAGLISPEQADLAVQKATSTKPLVEVKTGELESSFKKESGKSKAVRLNNILEQGDNAAKFNINLDAIESALDDGAFVGPGASKVATLNEFSAAFGLPSDLDKAANTRIIQQRVSDLTIQATGKLKGAISEKELDLAKKTIFELGTSELATKKAIGVLRTLSSYDQKLADLASDLESEGRFTTDFRAEKKKFDRQFRKDFRAQLKEAGKSEKGRNLKSLSNDEINQKLIEFGIRP